MNWPSIEHHKTEPLATEDRAFALLEEMKRLGQVKPDEVLVTSVQGQLWLNEVLPLKTSYY